MPKGKATGKDREYQEYCKRILLWHYSERALKPLADDGIDVTISGRGKTTITFDIALVDSSGNLLVAECKRWTGRVDQRVVLGFAGDLEWLRAEIGKEVTGVICTTKDFQDGAIKHATIAKSIEVVICKEGHTHENFGLSFRKYNSAIDRNTHQHHTTATCKLRLTARMFAVITRADGTIEELGELA